MSDILSEQLSSLLDGELPPEETTFLLKRLGREPELARRLGRYRLCGDVLRGERVQPRADFVVRVSSAIAAEAPLPPALYAGRGDFRVPWLKPLAGLAVAASVAVVAVLLLRQSPVMSPAQPLAVVASAPDPVPAGAARPPALARRVPAYDQGASEPVSYVTPAARPRRAGGRRGSQVPVNASKTRARIPSTLPTPDTFR